MPVVRASLAVVPSLNFSGIHAFDDNLMPLPLNITGNQLSVSGMCRGEG